MLYKLLFFKSSLLVFTGVIFFVLLSCSETPEQYQPNFSIASNINPKASFLITEASQPKGGLLLYQKELAATEALKDTSIREKSLLPIDYQEGSVAGISMETTYEEAQDILNFDFVTPSGLTVYKEGIAVAWREDAPRTPSVIFIITKYQGTMDFGPWIEESRHIRMGQSFANQFSVGEENKDILKDPKARHFITSLYKHLENTKEDCLENQSCSLSINPQGNFILFQLPKVTFLFGNNERRNLVQITITKDDYPACLKSPFDLLTAKFFCERPDGSRVVFGLGNDYKEVMQKSGINPELPIIYRNTILIQRTKSTIIAWKRKDFEEKAKTIPETTHLSVVYMGSHEYNIPFLLDQSLIKVTLEDSNTVHLSLEPLSQDGEQWTTQDIIEKLQASAASSHFYLSTEMPEIKGNYILQKNLIKAFLNLLAENYTKFYATPHSQPEIYKRLLGEYNDKFALKASGFLIVSKPEGFTNKDTKQYPLNVDISIDEPSGQMTLITSLVDDDFSNYIIQNQKHRLDLLQPLQELMGFKLGDKIYLRDKKMSSQTVKNEQKGLESAIVAYPVSEHQTLITLAEYSSEEESAAVYPSGRDKNIIFEKSEAISVNGATFYILPTPHTKDIESHVFDEYEIHKISFNGRGFFGTVSSLCAMEGLDAKMGLHDTVFSKQLITYVSQARKASSSEQPFEGCSYIAPLDSLFAGLKRTFFFPSHKLVLSFVDRELYGVTIYKKPTEGNSQ